LVEHLLGKLKVVTQKQVVAQWRVTYWDRYCCQYCLWLTNCANDNRPILP